MLTAVAVLAALATAFASPLVGRQTTSSATPASTVTSASSAPSASSTSSSSGTANVYATCRDFSASIYAASNNTNLTSVFGGPPANQQALVQSLIEASAAGSTVQQQIANASQVNVTGNYTLYFQYCAPLNNATPKGIFQTIHGLVGNAGYWNVKLPSGQLNLSFAEAAAQAGWATLSYDRLGVGRSDHPDGLDTVQISYEAAQAVSIASSLRAGNLSTIGNFSRIIGTGHSYGSNLLAGVASTAPNAFDAIVLTGFTNNVTMGPLGVAGFESTIASVAYPSRFSNTTEYTNSYVITPSVSIDQKEFFHFGGYNNESLQYFTNNKGEYTLGQTNSIVGTIPLPRQNFTKPVLVVTGQYDAPYCTANCSVTSLSGNNTQLDTARGLFPAAANFSTYVVPESGHGINFHNSAPMAYARIVQFANSL